MNRPLALLLGLLFFWHSASAQCSLSCNDDLNVSLDQSGFALINTSMLSPAAPSTCPGALELTLYNAVGQQIPNPLNCSHIGQIITAKVRHVASGNFCTGTLSVYDAISPNISCANKFVFCMEDPVPALTGYPTLSDNCTPAANLSLTHTDVEFPLSCDSMVGAVRVLSRTERTWTATDAAGNTNSCLQKIWLKHAGLSDIVFPPNRDNIALPALACGQDPTDLDLAGRPTVGGIPVENTPACEIAVSHTDQIIQVCPPAGFTVVRTWIAVDFCTGTVSNRVQIIKVEDKVVPNLTPPADISVGTDGFQCTTTVLLPNAVATDACSSVSVSPSWAYGNGFGPFANVPLGDHVVTYKATDACGNTRTATMKVTVFDNSPPQAVCVNTLQVSLGANGQGAVLPQTLNQGSSDNCGPVFLSISRDGIEYAPSVLVSCADLGPPLNMRLRVLDAVGLENFCEVQVSVRDFLKPQLACPAATTLPCTADPNDLSVTGQATATDNCTLQDLTHTSVANLNGCNVGTVTRTWSAVDAAGNTRTCTQLITLNVVNTTTVQFPANITVQNCISTQSFEPTATGQPILSGTACFPPNVTHTDQIFTTNLPPALCFRVLRTWKVIDFCVYDINNPTMGAWEQTQVIDIIDTKKPVIDLGPDITVAVDQPGCLAALSLNDAAVTDCSATTVTHNSPFATLPGANASGLYPIGTHEVVFTALDACGNLAQQTLRITVRDLTPPALSCPGGVNVPLGTGGMVSLHAAQFALGTTDNCTPTGSLLFAIAPQDFDCSSVGTQAVVLSATDEAGNTASCQTTINVLANGNCQGNQSFDLSGNIRNELGVPVRNIPVTLIAGVDTLSMVCDSTGFFHADSLPPSVACKLRPYNRSNWLNGVSTLDLVQISKHILGIQPLDSPYKMIAADANKSGSITTFDIVQIRKLILGVFDTFPGNTSWRFVEGNYVFPQPENPFSAPFPEEIVLPSLDSAYTALDFVGIKVGDVNESSNPTEAREKGDSIAVSLPERTFKAGEKIVLPLYVTDWETLEGFQLALSFDPTGLVLDSVSFPQPAILSKQHVFVEKNGRISLSWNAAGSLPSPGMPALYLHLKANTEGQVSESISLIEDRLPAEAYHAHRTEELGVKLQFFTQESGKIEAKPLFFRPNPFSETTQINLFSEKTEAATLQITGSEGLLLASQRVQLLEGENQLPFYAKDLPCAGLYHLRLVTESGQVLVGKLVRL